MGHAIDHARDRPTMRLEPIEHEVSIEVTVEEMTQVVGFLLDAIKLLRTCYRDNERVRVTLSSTSRSTRDERATCRAGR